MMKLIAALLLSSMLILAVCQSQSDQAVEPVVVIDSVASADGVMIHYEAQGAGERAVVFVHGWSCDQTYWVRQIETFKDEYRVVTLDLAGHGKSGTNREQWTAERFGDDVAAVVNQLGLKEVALVGHSMGGAICIEAARRLPEQTVVLVGVDTYQSMTKMPPPEFVTNFIEPFRNDFQSATYDFVQTMFPPGADSILVAQVAADMSSADSKIAIACFENMFVYDASVALADMRKPIRSINCEIWPTDVEGNRKVASSFEVVYMSNTGHFLHLEDPATFNILLRKILVAFFPQHVQG